MTPRPSYTYKYSSSTNKFPLEDVGFPFCEDYSDQATFWPTTVPQMRDAMPLAYDFGRVVPDAPAPTAALHTMRPYTVTTNYGPSSWTDQGFRPD